LTGRRGEKRAGIGRGSQTEKRGPRLKIQGEIEKTPSRKGGVQRKGFSKKARGRGKP